MNLNIDSILSQIGSTTRSTTNSTSTSNKNYVVTDNIFAQAEELVSNYQNQQTTSDNSSSTKSTFLSQFNVSQLSNMSTSEFLNYAYENKANSGYKDKSTDESGVELPLIVRYKCEVVSSAGKTFMQVVAKFKAKYPYKSETEIAAELMAKYGSSTSDSDSSSTGNSINISA